MYQFLLSTHSHTRWLVLVTAVVAIAMPFLNSTGTVTKKSRIPALAFMIICDIQLLVGLMLYFGDSPYGIKAFDSGMSFVMKNADFRKIAVEHLILMLLAISLVHIGYSKAKKAVDNNQLKKISMRFFAIALIAILAGIPWARL
jgi:hypothetical protein